MPNYDEKSVREACDVLKKHTGGKRDRVMVDCSHANSAKVHTRQLVVAEELTKQMASDDKTTRDRIFGVMVESHLHEGAQSFTPGQDDPSQLKYGLSITDACLGWENSVKILDMLAVAVKQRRSRGS